MNDGQRSPDYTIGGCVGEGVHAEAHSGTQGYWRETHSIVRMSAALICTNCEEEQLVSVVFVEHECPHCGDTISPAV